MDSGGALAGALLQAGLVEELSLLVAPHLVGDPAARPLFREVSAAGLRLGLIHVARCQDGPSRAELGASPRRSDGAPIFALPPV